MYLCIFTPVSYFNYIDIRTVKSVNNTVQYFALGNYNGICVAERSITNIIYAKITLSSVTPSRLNV